LETSVNGDRRGLVAPPELTADVKRPAGTRVDSMGKRDDSSADSAVMPCAKQPGTNDEKQFRTRLAMGGYTMLRRQDGRGFVIGRWDRTRRLETLAKVEAFLATAMGRRP
jgi:hypothetical protein